MAQPFLSSVCSKSYRLLHFWANMTWTLFLNLLFPIFLSNFFLNQNLLLWTRLCLMESHHKVFCLFYFFKQNKIRSLTDFSTKKPALRENISLFYLFLFFKNKNILWILLQCSWCDILILTFLVDDCCYIHLLKKYVGG